MINDELRSKLIQEAIAARKWAYAPYSHYSVGAAVLAGSGRIYSGVNVENAAFPTTICAERTAIFSAVSQGEREFDAIAVVTANGGTPCGSCRQVLAEFGLEIVVIIADQEGNLIQETTVDRLLPAAFRPGDLP